MLSKEEIEKAKEWLIWMKKQEAFLPYTSNILQYIDLLEQENNKQNKIIDETSEQLAGLALWNNKKDQPLILGDKEEVKQYFEKKVEDQPMELEEAIKALNSYLVAIDTFGTMDYKCINNLYTPIKTVLQALEDSVPKKKIEDKIKEIKSEECFGLANAIKNSEIKILQELLEE